jgi:hypothetical protein
VSQQQEFGIWSHVTGRLFNLKLLIVDRMKKENLQISEKLP